MKINVKNRINKHFITIFNDIKSKIGDVSISIKGPIENPAFNFH